MAFRGKKGTEFDSEKMFRRIAEVIVSGGLPFGHQLPTYAELAELYEVKPNIVGRVMFALRMCGFVRGVQGGHTYVSDEWRHSPGDKFRTKNL